MNELLILYTGDDWDRDQPEYSPSQQLAYSLWGQMCLEKGIKLTRAAVNFFEDGKFVKHWEYTPAGWIKLTDPFLPSVVYDKSRMYHKTTGEYLSDVVKFKLAIDK